MAKRKEPGTSLDLSQGRGTQIKVNLAVIIGLVVATAVVAVAWHQATVDRFRRHEFEHWRELLEAKNPDIEVPELLHE